MGSNISRRIRSGPCSLATRKAPSPSSVLVTVYPALANARSVVFRINVLSSTRSMDSIEIQIQCNRAAVYWVVVNSLAGMQIGGFLKGNMDTGAV